MSTPSRSLASACARFRINSAANGELLTPLRPEFQLGGRDSEIYSTAPSIEVGVESAYVRNASALCLALIGSGSTCCLNDSNCPLASHKGGNKLETGTGPFFIQLH